MTRIRGFPPIGRPDARILILGSMPSLESLNQQRYYAHPRNAFWPLMTSIYGLTGENYRERTNELADKGVAVWDVLKSCFRSGSLDSAIEDSTLVTNDFEGFFGEHPGIARVFFNGAKAESVFLKKVMPQLGAGSGKLSLMRLPSTSPAHAGMSLHEKKKAWRIALLEQVE